jgi:hypothetical protein
VQSYGRDKDDPKQKGFLVPPCCLGRITKNENIENNEFIEIIEKSLSTNGRAFFLITKKEETC